MNESLLLGTAFAVTLISLLYERRARRREQEDTLAWLADVMALKSKETERRMKHNVELAKIGVAPTPRVSSVFEPRSNTTTFPEDEEAADIDTYTSPTTLDSSAGEDDAIDKYEEQLNQ